MKNGVRGICEIANYQVLCFQQSVRVRGLVLGGYIGQNFCSPEFILMFLSLLELHEHQTLPHMCHSSTASPGVQQSHESLLAPAAALWQLALQPIEA